MTIEKVLLEHGSGRGLAELFGGVIAPALLPRHAGVFEDSAVLDFSAGRLAFTTDSFVVQPIEFPGADIGKLAACGTINDLSMSGAVPKWMAVSLILEEGLNGAVLDRVLVSLRRICEECGVAISCGDTKVVEKRGGDGIFITTTGIGVVPAGLSLSAANARVGDAVLVSGPVGAHGIAVLAARRQLGFASETVSDCAPLQRPVRALLQAAPQTRVMRDATRGGCSTVLNEIASDSGVTIRLKGSQIPVSPSVAGACSFLGFDPLDMANEGTFVAVVPQSQASQALDGLRGVPQSSRSCVIGVVEEKGRFPVVLETEIGGTRPVEVPAGSLLPRIC